MKRLLAKSKETKQPLEKASGKQAQSEGGKQKQACPGLLAAVTLNLLFESQVDK